MNQLQCGFHYGICVYYNTPIGEIMIGEKKSKSPIFYLKKFSPFWLCYKRNSYLAEANRQLQEYFKGQRKEFKLDLNPSGTEFMKKVWESLRKIPYGETRSYKDIAISIGHDKAYRAVGLANNRNPISIIIPCHRVIGANGSLVGYGGGLDIKTFLLELERSNTV